MMTILTGTYPELERMFWQAYHKHVNRVNNKKQKEPKGKASDGEYCPKEKFGQSWAYSKGEKNDEN